jgi:hypothetical protein
MLIVIQKTNYEDIQWFWLKLNFQAYHCINYLQNSSSSSFFFFFLVGVAMGVVVEGLKREASWAMV